MQGQVVEQISLTGYTGNMQNDITDFQARIQSLAEHRSQPEWGFFGPESTVWQINRERINILGGLRAVLMQLAHPAVAQGVAEHSNFQQDPIGRLTRTMDVVHSILFGPTDEAIATATRVFKRHQAVQGQIGNTQQHYYANDPALLLWVYTTLIDSLMHTYQILFTETPRSTWESFYIEIQPFGYLFGIPEGTMPDTLNDFNDYVIETLETIDVSEIGREMGRAVLQAPHPVFGFSNKVLAAGTLPECLLEPFGIAKTRTTDFFFSTTIQIIRRAVPFLPKKIRYTKKARRKKHGRRF